MTLDEVRPHLVGFDAKRYTNPTMMYDALHTIGRPWLKVGARWPNYGLARVQWEGPWTKPGAPMRARYRYTHWIGGWFTTERGYGVFDINCINNGTGWVTRQEWKDYVVPALTYHYPRASGDWHITHGIEIEKPT